MKKYVLVLLIPFLLFGCSEKPSSEKNQDVITKDAQVEKETEEMKKKELSDDELKVIIVEKHGKSEKPVFKLVDESSLTEKEQEQVKLHRNAVGVSYLGDNLFTIVANSKENTLRYITEASIDKENIHVFIRKDEAGSEGEGVLVGRIDGFDDMDEMVWFMDAETEQPIQLEDMESAVKKENDEKAEKADVEVKEEDKK